MEEAAAPVALEEAEYVARLGCVIRRDFFPDAPEVPARVTQRAARQKKKKKKKKGKNQEEGEEAAELVDDAELSVDGFQALYTTEGSKAFARIQAREAQQRHHRLAQAFPAIRDGAGARGKPANLLLLGDAHLSQQQEAQRGREQQRARKRRKRVVSSNTRLAEDFWDRGHDDCGSVFSGRTEQTVPGFTPPTVNGYTFVAPMPPPATPTRHERLDTDDSDNDSGDTSDGRKQFTMPQRPRRDEIALLLGRGAEFRTREENRAKRRKERANRGSSKRRKASRKELSPAARKLASRLAG